MMTICQSFVSFILGTIELIGLRTKVSIFLVIIILPTATNYATNKAGKG